MNIYRLYFFPAKANLLYSYDPFFNKKCILFHLNFFFYFLFKEHCSNNLSWDYSPNNGRIFIPEGKIWLVEPDRLFRISQCVLILAKFNESLSSWKQEVDIGLPLQCRGVQTNGDPKMSLLFTVVDLQARLWYYKPTVARFSVKMML